MIILYIHNFAKKNKQQNCLCNSAIDDAPEVSRFRRMYVRSGNKS